MTIFFLFPLFIGIVGFANFFFHSKERNMFGYRSQLSLKNDKMWCLAQKTTGTSLMSASSFIICLNILLIQMDISSNNSIIILLSASLLSILYTIVYTESILENTYLKLKQNQINK